MHTYKESERETIEFIYFYANKNTITGKYLIIFE